MAQHNTSRRLYKWRVTRSVDGTTLKASHTGADSAEVLGDLFALWTKEFGDISSWADAPRFGTLVTRHSDLSPEVVAVWLGLSKSDIGNPLDLERTLALDEPVEWELSGPEGHSMKLERILKD